MAFGQFGVVVDPAKVDVACPDEECHVAPVFMGEGGFVGELADGFDMANFVVSCGNTTASGSAAGGADGVVRELFSMANGLACHEEGGSFQIHGLADGGWYWINDDMNSAVSPLIAKDALMGDEVMPTDPGGVTLMASDYGTYVKSGSRVGILPHFVPTAPVEIPEMPEPEAATICMPVLNANRTAYIANDKDCMLGDGGTTIVMTAVTADGRSSEVTSVHRNPRDGAPIRIHLDLWGNGSGHVSNTGNSHLGWDLSGRGRSPESYRAVFSAIVDANDSLGTGLAEAGISLTRGRPETTRKQRPVPAGPNVGGTPEREDGYTKNSPDGVAQCKQAKESRSTDDAGGTAEFILWAAAGGGEVAIRADDEGADANNISNRPASDATLEELATWVAGFNARTDASKDIMTVTVRDGGGDGVGGDNAANDVDRAIPAVICEMEDDPAADPETRYVGATLTISPDAGTAYCDQSNNRTAMVSIGAYSARGDAANNVTPKIAQTHAPWSDTLHNLNASTALQVHCAE